MNNSYAIDQLRQHFERKQSEGWSRTDALDGNLALTEGGGSGSPTAQGKETRNHQQSKIPRINFSKTDKLLNRIKQESPELYRAGEIEFSDEMEKHKSLFTRLLEVVGRSL